MRNEDEIVDLVIKVCIAQDVADAVAGILAEDYAGEMDD